MIVIKVCKPGMELEVIDIKLPADLEHSCRKCLVINIMFICVRVM
jgi:hypothetical protein